LIFMTNMLRNVAPLICILAMNNASAAETAIALEDVAFHQTIDDAWWTGPLRQPTGSRASAGRRRLRRCHGISIQSVAGPARSLGFAPAIEYNWSANAGVIVGAKFTAAGHNIAAAIIPIAAINLVF
jgi:hypothetical protein